MPLMDESRIRFRTDCCTCHRKFPGGPYVLYQDLIRAMQNMGWVRVYDKSVCRDCARTVEQWRDGVPETPKIVLRKRRRR